MKNSLSIPAKFLAATAVLSVIAADLAVATLAFTPVAQAATAPTAKKTAVAYKRVSYNGYTFEVPSVWKAIVTEAREDMPITSVVFRGAKGERLAYFSCADRPLDFGDGQWDMKGVSRSVIANGFLYEIGKTYATSMQKGESDFAMVSMNHVGYKTQTETMSDPGYGCLLDISSMPNLKTIASRIYTSVKVETWKTATGADTSFRYPSAWTATSPKYDDAAGGVIRTFTDMNGRIVAELVCAPMVTAYTGDESTIYAERTFSKKGNTTRVIWSDDSFFEGHTHSFVSWYDDSKLICEVFARQEGQNGFIREIYKSVK